jgi:hypothetical protein
MRLHARAADLTNRGAPRSSGEGSALAASAGRPRDSRVRLVVLDLYRRVGELTVSHAATVGVPLARRDSFYDCWRVDSTAGLRRHLEGPGLD